MDEIDARRRWRSRLVPAAKTLLALSLLALAVGMNRQALRDVAARPLDPRPFAAAFGLYLVGVTLAMGRWYLLVRAVGLAFRCRDALRLGYIALLFNLVIPGAIGGDFVKAAFLCREQGKRLQPIASVVIDRLVGVLGLFLLAAIAGTLGGSWLDPRVRGLAVAAWAATLITGAILAAAFVPTLRRWAARRHDQLAAVGTAYRARLWVVPLAVGLSLLTNLLHVLAFERIDRALFPDAPPLAAHLLIVPLVLFTTAAPLPLGSLGLSEGTSGELFQWAGAAGGAVAMLAYRLLLLGGAVLGAAVYLASVREVRELVRGRPERAPGGLHGSSGSGRRRPQTTAGRNPSA